MPQFDSPDRDTTGTRGHRQLHEFLVDVMGFIVEDEYPAGVYSIDCYAEEVHAGFEYDGKDFHSSTAQRRRDSGRDSWIMSELGIPIMRFTGPDLLKGNRPALFDLVSGWIESHDDVETRRSFARRTE